MGCTQSKAEGARVAPADDRSGHAHYPRPGGGGAAHAAQEIGGLGLGKKALRKDHSDDEGPSRPSLSDLQDFVESARDKLSTFEVCSGGPASRGSEGFTAPLQDTLPPDILSSCYQALEDDALAFRDAIGTREAGRSPPRYAVRPLTGRFSLPALLPRFRSAASGGRSHIRPRCLDPCCTCVFLAAVP